jgi:hypothetical protein
MGLMQNLSSSLKQAGDQASGDAAAINDKAQQIQALKAQGPLVSSAPSAPAPKAPTGSSGFDKVNKPGSTAAHRVKGQDRDAAMKIVKDAKPLGSFKKGGKVKKTGIYKLHAKERVLNAKQAKKVSSPKKMSALFGK